MGIILESEKEALEKAEKVLEVMKKLELRIGKLIPISEIDHELKSKMNKEEIRMAITYLLNLHEIDMPRWEFFRIINL